MWNYQCKNRGVGAVVWSVRLASGRLGVQIPAAKKQVVTVPLLNARQHVWVSRVFGNDHYKRMPPCHSRCGMLKNPRSLLNEYECQALVNSPAIVTSPYEWKILEWDEKLETNKQKQWKSGVRILKCCVHVCSIIWFTSTFRITNTRIVSLTFFTSACII